jgi:parvulin-like peptidyl-prolyl isomerase
MDRNAHRRPLFLLAVGAAAGISLAGAGLLDTPRPGPTLPAGAVAAVNGQIIRAQEYHRVLDALARDRRDGVDETQRRYVLNRLIDEELLIQRGLELGLAYHDTRVRKNLTTAVIDSIVADYRDLQPTEAELRTFYEEQRQFFAQSELFRARQVWCRILNADQAAAARERAQQAAQRLRSGELFTTVRDELGDAEIAPVPDALLPAAKLADYLGPTALRTLLALEVGEASDPQRSATGYHVLQLVERKAGNPPALAMIREQVLGEFRRRAADEALRSYLDDLRQRAEVVTTTELQ